MLNDSLGTLVFWSQKRFLVKLNFGRGWDSPFWNSKYVTAAQQYLLSAEELHAEQRKDEDEQKQEEEKRDDWTHAVEQRYHEIT